MYYATAKKASVPSTFDEETCKSLVGQEIEGVVQRVDCEPYEVVDQDTGEVRTMDFRWVYVKEGETIEEAEVEQHEEEPELV